MQSNGDLKSWADRAWETGKARFFHPRTNLFYEFISSYDLEHRFDLLPTLEEIARQYPNPNGWATGMEDSTINGGVMLAAICDRHAVTGEAHLKQEAAQIYQGLHLCGTSSADPGLVLRSVSPWDGKSYFIETSRDQLTHFAHGLWRFFHSPLADDTQREQIKRMMVALSRRLEANIVPENDYHFLREDGTWGIPDRMWGDIKPHESSRLPMIYGVTWELTGDAHWRELYEQYVRPAAEHAAELSFANVPQRPCYGLFQHQCAMEALLHLATDDRALQKRWRDQMNRIGEQMPVYSRKVLEYKPIDVGDVADLDFRVRPNRERFVGSDFGHAPLRPEAMDHCSKPLRELGESIFNRAVAPDLELTDEQWHMLEKGFIEVDYDLVFACTLLYPQAGYWRALASQKLDSPVDSR